MSGVLVLVVVGLWTVIGRWAWKSYLRPRVANGRRRWVGLAFAVAWLVLPMTDEILGAYQFRRLCAEIPPTRYYGPIAVGPGAFFDEEGLIRTPSTEYYTYVLAVAPNGRFAVVPEGYEPYSWDSSITFLITEAENAVFSPDSKLLVEGFSGWTLDDGMEGAVQLRAVPPANLLGVVPSLDPLKTLTPHTATVMAIAFTPDGQVIISGALDGVIRLWGIP